MTEIDYRMEILKMEMRQHEYKTRLEKQKQKMALFNAAGLFGVTILAQLKNAELYRLIHEIKACKK